MRRRQVLLSVQTITAGNVLDGQAAETLVTVRQVWANIVPMTGSETIKAQAVESKQTHTIYTEFFVGATTAMRLNVPHPESTDEQPIDPLRRFEVESVVNVEERNRELAWRVIEVS